MKKVNNKKTKVEVKKTTKEKVNKVDKYKYLILFGILIFTSIIYWQTTKNNFISGDDYILIVQESDIQSFDNVPKFFTQAYHFMYCPVKMLIHTFEYQLCGKSPVGYHIFSLFFHLINICIIFSLILKLLKKTWAAIIAAVLFAIHPINVETVCWVTGHGDLLYVMFYLGGMLAYINYCTKEYKYKYLIITLLLFVLSALSKVSAFTFPLVLLVLDWWFRRKIFSWRVILEKIPFFLGALALGLSAIILRSEHATPLADYFARFNYFEAALLFLYQIELYIVKFFVPYGLALPLPHPFWSSLPLALEIYIFPLILIGIILIIIFCKKIRRPLIFTTLLYFATLFSSLRLTPMLGTIGADRYFYVSIFAFVFFIAWLFTYISENKNKQFLNIFIVIIICFSITLTVLTVQRIPVFKDGITLFSDACNKYPKNTTPIFELAGAYEQEDDYENTIKLLDEAIIARPNNVATLNMKMQYMTAMDNLEEQLSTIRKIVIIEPNSKDFLNKAIIHYKLNQIDSILPVIEQVFKYEYDSAVYVTAMQLKTETLNNLQQYDIALATADTLLKHYPTYYNILKFTAIAKFRLENIDDAISDLETLINLYPNDSQNYLNVGKMYFSIGNRKACDFWKKAAELGNGEAQELYKNCR